MNYFIIFNKETGREVSRVSLLDPQLIHAFSLKENEVAVEVDDPNLPEVELLSVNRSSQENSNG